MLEGKGYAISAILRYWVLSDKAVIVAKSCGLVVSQPHMWEGSVCRFTPKVEHVQPPEF
jgi:hypothetical protein